MQSIQNFLDSTLPTLLLPGFVGLHLGFFQHLLRPWLPKSATGQVAISAQSAQAFVGSIGFSPFCLQICSIGFILVSPVLMFLPHLNQSPPLVPLQATQQLRPILVQSTETGTNEQLVSKA